MHKRQSKAKVGVIVPRQHSVYDSDSHFFINSTTREITTESEKLILVNHDHNSERYTFEIPRIIEGHDMSECNLVQVHFTNYNSPKTLHNSDVYTVEDLQVSTDDDSIVIFSWLVSGSATQHNGTVSFGICFKCISEDGTIDYAWHTSEFSGISVLGGVHNIEAVTSKYSDFVSRVEGLLSYYSDVVTKQQEILESIPENLSELNNDLVFDSVVLNDSTIEKRYELVVTNGKVTLTEKG